MNATAAISKAFLDGKVLSIKTGFRDFGVTNLPREVSRLIEKRFGVQLARVPKAGKTKYDVPCRWFEYRLPKTEYNKDGIERMREYVGKHFGQVAKPSGPEGFKDRNQLNLYD